MFINKKKKINYLFYYSYYSHVFNTFLMILLSKKNSDKLACHQA